MHTIRFIKLLGSEKKKTDKYMLEFIMTDKSVIEFDPINRTSLLEIPRNELCLISLKINTIETCKSISFDSNIFGINENICIPLYQITTKITQEETFTGILFQGAQLNGLLSPYKAEISERVLENHKETKSIYHHQHHFDRNHDDCSGKVNKYIKDSKEYRDIIEEITKKINTDNESSIIRYQKLAGVEKKTKESLLNDIQKLKNDISREHDENKKKEKFILNDTGNASFHFSS